MNKTAPTERIWRWEDLQTTVQANYEDPDLDLVRLAYDFAKDAHEGQKRYTGAPYIIHPIATAVRLAELKLPLNIVIAGLLHDVPEDTECTIEEVRENFGDDVAMLVGGVTKLGKVRYRGIDRYAENLRKMFLAMATDVRVVFIKFADRLHNLETLNAIPEHKRARVANEVLEIYAPIASRLGMGEMKGRLEDLAFKYANRSDFDAADQVYSSQIQTRQADLQTTIDHTKDILTDSSIEVIDIRGRQKYLYSFWQKYLRYHRDVTKIYDIVAIRIILNSVADCYAVLGIIHSNWTPLKGRIKDYIAQPKPNGYQSLHTTVFDENCGVVEFQIRTEQMHNEAEYGIAAHWRYKEGEQPQEAIEKNLKWMQDLVEIHKEIDSGEDFLKHLEEVKLDMFQNRIFVLTPEADVIDLPEGSTPVDFAYAIHTEVGDQCTAAHVNNQAVPLDTELKSGDMCSIVTDKRRKGPNPDWLKFVKTNGAKTKIRAATRSRVKSWIDSMMKK